MTDRTHPDSGPATPGEACFTAADMATAEARGFRDGVASVAASAGSEPVAWRVRRHDAPNYWIIFLHRPVDALADPEREVQPLYTHPSPPEGMAAEQALLKVLAAVQRYLPPDGPSEHDTLTEIIEVVDPWPLGQLDKS